MHWRTGGDLSDMDAWLERRIAVNKRFLELLKETGEIPEDPA